MLFRSVCCQKRSRIVGILAKYQRFVPSFVCGQINISLHALSILRHHQSLGNPRDAASWVTFTCDKSTLCGDEMKRKLAVYPLA